jgi:branched-subunit amino acid ABC-type transport system permease component
MIGVYVSGIGTNLAIIASFALLVIILITRPQGLFGGLRPIEEPVQL